MPKKHKKKTVPQPAPQPKPAKKKKNKPRGGISSQEGVLHFQRHELMASLQTDASGKAVKSLPVHPDSFPFLKGLGNLFERAQWRVMRVYYKPAVGTTVGGLVSYGVSWDSTTKDSRAKIAALTPNCSHAVWADTTLKPLVLPPGKLQSRNWYVLDAKEVADKQPCSIEVAVESEANKLIGEIWYQYSITLMGTTS